VEEITGQQTVRLSAQERPQVSDFLEAGLRRSTRRFRRTVAWLI
jgi:hypothetical protein